MGVNMKKSLKNVFKRGKKSKNSEDDPLQDGDDTAELRDEATNEIEDKTSSEHTLNSTDNPEDTTKKISFNDEANETMNRRNFAGAHRKSRRALREESRRALDIELCNQSQSDLGASFAGSGVFIDVPGEGETGEENTGDVAQNHSRSRSRSRDRRSSSHGRKASRDAAARRQRRMANGENGTEQKRSRSSDARRHRKGGQDSGRQQEYTG